MYRLFFLQNCMQHDKEEQKQTSVFSKVQLGNYPPVMDNVTKINN